jgi:hypothetical protein
MKRRWFAVLGAFLLVGESAVLVAFGFPPPLDAGTALPFVLWAFVGILLVLGGLSVEIGTVEWHQFVGTANVLMGIWFGVGFPLTTLRDASLGDAGVIFAAVAGVVGGLSMVFIGASWIRGSQHFKTSKYEPGPIFAFTSRNQT